MQLCPNVVTKRVLAIIATLALATVLLPATAMSAWADEPAQDTMSLQADFPDDFPLSDVCGDCTWTIDKTGLLKIDKKPGKSGKLASFNGDRYKVPWWQYREVITEVKIGSGVKCGEEADYMFDGMKQVTEIDLSNLGTENTTSMEHMFSGCEKLAGVTFSDKFDTSKVSDMDYMFADCVSLVECPDFSQFNTELAVSAEGMFKNCKELTSLDLANFNTLKMTSMAYMFDGCKSLEEVRLGEKFSFNGATNKRLCKLPKPAGSETGKWVNTSTKEKFLPADIPNKVSAIYRPDGGEIKFEDVDTSTPHHKDIEWMAANGISTGWDVKGKYYFYGTRDILRQDMAAFMHRLGKLAGVGEDGTIKLSFTDVNSDTPHYEDIKWLASTGISTGWKVGSKYEFRGTSNIARQDMAAFMRRLADLADDGEINGSTSEGSIVHVFEDVKDTTPHYEDIIWLATNGISEGWKEGGKYYFKGTAAVKRQDCAAFMHRLADVMGV